MIAVTYLQSLLACLAFFGFIGLTLGTLVWSATLLDKHPRWWFLIILAAVLAMSLLTGTFVWLGSGPLNG